MTARRYLNLRVALVALLGAGAVAWAQAPSIDQIDANSKRRAEQVKQISDALGKDEIQDSALDGQLTALIQLRNDLIGLLLTGAIGGFCG